MTRFCLLLLGLLCLGADIAFGADAPQALVSLLETEPPEAVSDGEDAGFAGEKRLSAMRAAALGFGAQAGLARRSWEIGRMLERHAPRLSAIYRFRNLMLNEGGFTVMPPVLDGTDRAFRLDRDGARAARARRVVRIVAPEKIVSAAPDWRDFLVRDWRTPTAPAGILFPRDEAERASWRRWLREGWAEGTALADDIFAADLERLNRVFEGLVDWRRAHLARMVSAPSIETERTAISGHGRLVRIDETVASLGPPVRFELRPGRWMPLLQADTPPGGHTPSSGSTPSGGHTPSGGSTPSGGDTPAGGHTP